MQLSLRTLLAFEDNIFDIEQRRQLERTIPNHEPATQILARIRNVIHDPKINVPGRNGYQEELDPNIVAEYLDYQMTKDYQEQFENFCLSSDKYLAEVASIHQIISNVLGEPARISRECRFRCYDLFQKFQQLNNRYENENQFIPFPQIHASLPVSQSVSQSLSPVGSQLSQSRDTQNNGENYENNYYENSNQNNIQNSQNEQNIIKLSQKNEKDKKNESEKNTNEPIRKSIRDAASIVAVIIVIVLLFLNYRNDNSNAPKNNTAQITDNNNFNKNFDKNFDKNNHNDKNNFNPQNFEQSKNNQTEISNNPESNKLDNFKSESEIKQRQIHEQNVIRTVSTTNNELNAAKFTPAEKIEKEKHYEINPPLTEIKTTSESHNSTEPTNSSAQPLPLPFFVTNNNDIPPTSETQINPFNITPPTSITPPPNSPAILPSSKVEPITDSAETNTAANIATSPILTSTPTPPINSNSNSNSNELFNPQPLNPPAPNTTITPKNINETEIKFREQKQPETPIIDSSVWKTQTPNFNSASNQITNENNNKFESANYRNDNSSVMHAGGENNYSATHIVQVNNNSADKNAHSKVENSTGISVTKKTGALGTVLATNDPMVIFTADSSESQWRFESNQFNLYANQYILTSAPFRADISLGDNFIIEIIGDSKMCVLPPNNGVAIIYVDYGRLIIRANYDQSTAMKQVKSIRICTERGEATIGFNGTKSVAFVDTFAEISRTQPHPDSNRTNAKSTSTQTAEIQVGMNPIIGLLPDPQESISWLPSKQNAPFITKNDMSIVLAESQSERGIIRNHPNWLRRISVPEEGKQIESVCINIFNRKDVNLETALQILLNEKSETVRSFAYRIWGDLGRFDMPLKGRIVETESIQLSLVQYFKEVIKRDAESIQRLTEAIEKERTKK